MKRVVGYIGLICIILWPATALCQGFFGPVASPSPEFGGSNLAPTTDNRSGFSLGGSSIRLLPPKAYFLWSPNSSMIKLSLVGDTTDGMDSAWGTAELLWSTNGCWLGLSLPVSFYDRLSLTADAWYFLPGNLHIEAAGEGTNTATGSGGIAGNLNVRTDWFAVELRAAYEMTPGLSFIGGLRYDYLQGTISVPDNLEQLIFQSVGIPFRVKLDVNLNSIFPYVGLMYATGSPSNQLTMFLKGFPAALAVSENAPHSAYFGEIGLEYSVSPLSFNDVSVSFLAKANAARAVFKELSDIVNIFDKTVPPMGTVALDQSLSVNWIQYYVGGTITFNYDLPFSL